MLGQREQRAIVDDVAIAILAGDRRLHAVVEDLDRHPADGGEGEHVAAQQRLQVLVHDEAGKDVPGMAEHQREQPDDPGDPRLVGEGRDEAGEVDLRLVSRRRLEADLERLGFLLRPDGRDEALHRRVGTLVAALADLAGEADGAQIGEGRHPLAQIVEIGRQLVRPADLARPIDRRLEPAFDVFAHRLWITPGAPGNRRDRQPLAVKLQDHHQFSKLDHRRRSLPNRIGKDRRQPASGPNRRNHRQPEPGSQLGNFRRPFLRRIQRTMTG